MKFLLFLLMACCLLIDTTYAQLDLNTVGRKKYLGDFVPVRRKLNYSEIEGTPYAEEVLLEGYLILKRGDTVKNYFRYNIYTDEIEYLDGQELKVLLNHYEMDRLLLDGVTYVRIDYNSGIKLKSGYLIPEVEGPCALYKKLNVTFNDPMPPRSSYDKATPANFERKSDQWFISFDGAPARMVALNKNVIRKVFPPRDVRNLEEYVDKNKLKPKREMDFVKIITYYNRIRENP